MTPRPTIWRSPTARAATARVRRQRDLAAMRKLAEAHDHKAAAAAPKESK